MPLWWNRYHLVLRWHLLNHLWVGLDWLDSLDEASNAVHRHGLRLCKHYGLVRALMHHLNLLHLRLSRNLKLCRYLSELRLINRSVL